MVSDWFHGQFTRLLSIIKRYAMPFMQGKTTNNAWLLLLANEITYEPTITRS